MLVTALLDKIHKKDIKIGIVGLGYVGLPLACEFAKADVSVLGFDVDSQKIANITQGKSYIQDVSSGIVSELVKKKRLEATTAFNRIGEVDLISICVPTPLRKTKDPDMSYILKALEQLKPHVRKGQVVVLESTTYPGTTQEVLQPQFEERGFKIGEDFFLAFSPERVDPGNPRFYTRNTPKIVGGVTPNCVQVSKAIYELAIDTVITVSCPKTAEMVKLLENTFRSVNIGMANELLLMCNKLNVDTWEVIEAAATKPFGFMPFYPGPGLGGHCIPIDPFYLSWKLKTLNYDARFINLAGEVNGQMPHFVVQKIQAALNQRCKSVNGSNILIIGVAYKPNISDTRESPAIDIMVELMNLGAKVSYHDDLAPVCELTPGMSLQSQALSTQLLKQQECVVVVTNHKGLDIETIVTHSTLVVDTRNATKGKKNSHIIRL